MINFEILLKVLPNVISVNFQVLKGKSLLRFLSQLVHINIIAVTTAPTDVTCYNG